MIVPSIPADEANRIAALHKLYLLDTSEEERFDRITRTAASLFQVPCAAISLVDETRQWFKSHTGTEITEIPRHISFCGHAILEDASLVIPDARQDLRFANNPLVTGDPYIRFYASRPLKTSDGSRVGTLCLASPQPRQMSETELQSLNDLAGWAEYELNLIEQNQQIRQLKYKEVRLQNLLDNVVDGIITLDNEGTIGSLNRSGEQIFGYSEAEVIGRNIEFLMPDFYHNAKEIYLINPQLSEIAGVGREILGQHKNGTTFPLDFAMSQTQFGENALFTGLCRNISERKQVEKELQFQREFTNSLMQNSPVATFGINKNHEIIFWNKAIEELTGLKAEEMIGTDKHLDAFYGYHRSTLSDILIDGVPDQPGNFHSNITFSSSLVKNGLQAEGWFAKLNGKTRYLVFEASPLYDSQGELIAVIETFQDITNQKRVQEAYRESEEKLHTIISNAPIALFALDAEGVITFMEGKGLQAQDLEPGQLVGLSALEVYKDNPTILENTRRALQGQCFNSIAQAGDRTLQIFNAPILDENQKLYRAIGVSVDITEQIKAEAELEQQRNFATQIMNSLGQGLAVVDKAYAHFEYVNPALCEMLGYSADEILEHGPTYFMHRKDQPKLLEAWEQRKPGKPVQCEVRFIRSDGSKIYTLLTIVPRMEGNEFVGVISVMTDLTARNQAEEALRASEEKYRSIIATMEEGVVLMNLQGTIISCNTSAERILGIPADQLMGRTPIDPSWNIIREDGSPFPGETLPAMVTIRTGQPCSNVIMGVYKPDGNLRWVSVNSQPCRREDGVQYGVVCTFNDITERQKVERLKQEFISTVSHELRTPLTSIRGALGLVAGGIVGEIPSQAQTLLQIAHKNSERLVLLINDILDIEKIESGQMSFNCQPLELLPLVQQAIETNQLYATEYQVEFVLGKASAGLKAIVDSNRLIQVITNFLSNAAKFSLPGDRVEVSIVPRGQMVRVSVTDHGPGIPAEFRHRIFQKFAQADSSSTREKGGSGLGLSIAKAIIQKLDGQIGFETAEDIGTTFYFDLPLYIEQDEINFVKNQVDQSYSQTRRAKILHIEGDSDLRNVVVFMLQEMAQVTSVASLREARSRLAAATYDLILLDLELPDGNGLDLLEQLQNANIPVVVFSASENSRKLSGQVASVLVKSRTTNQELQDTIRCLISPGLIEPDQIANSISA